MKLEFEPKKGTRCYLIRLTSSNEYYDDGPNAVYVELDDILDQAYAARKSLINSACNNAYQMSSWNYEATFLKLDLYEMDNDLEDMVEVKRVPQDKVWGCAQAMSTECDMLVVAKDYFYIKALQKHTEITYTQVEYFHFKELENDKTAS